MNLQCFTLGVTDRVTLKITTNNASPLGTWHAMKFRAVSLEVCPVRVPGLRALSIT